MTSDEDGDSVEDSQCSESEGPIIRPEVPEEPDHFVFSSLEEESSADESNGSVTDRNEKKNKDSTVRSSFVANVWGGKEEISVGVKSYDLGHHFDPSLSSSLDRIRTLTKLADNSPANPKSKALFDAEWHDLKVKEVSPHYIDLVLKESISKKYLDWHFITENSQFDEVLPNSFLCDSDETLLERYPTLESLLVAFGVAPKTLDLIQMENSPLSSSRHNDTLCQLSPFDAMIDAFACYQEKSEQYARYFICFILDRKVYESICCDTLWCSKIYKTFSPDAFVQVHLSLVDSKDYFLHHRLIKLIPTIQDVLVRRVLFNAKDLTEDQAKDILVEEFNDLFDKRRFQQLLYFVLVIYGSKYMPFGDSYATRYFKDCTVDLFNASASDVELSLLNGFLSIFAKIQP